MKSKIKKPQEASKMNVSGYTMKLKTDLATLLALPAEERPTPFVLHLDYAFGDEPSILFLVGMSNDWKKYVKSQGWLKSPLVRQTWLGTCELIGEDMHLLVRKGKIPRSQFNAGIKKNAALKKLNWIITEEISDEEDDDLLNEDDEKEPSPATENQADKARADQINAQLVKLIPNLKGATPEQRQTLLSQIEKLSDALYAIPNWENYTNDNIEKYLQQIEVFLAQQEAQKPEESPKETASKLSQQLAAYLAAFKKAATPADKQKAMAALQNTAAKLYEVPNWQDHTDDRLETILAQLPKPKNDADDTFIADHKAKINEMTTVEAVAKHSQLVAQLAATPKQKEFAKTVADYAAHLAQGEQLVNPNLDAQEQAKAIINNPTSAEKERQAATDALKALEEALKTFLN